MAMEQAQAAGAKEAIIVDGRGRVLEGTTSNVFVVHAGTVLTPPESVGILPGITRKLLIDVACELEMAVKVTTLTTGDLLSADEAFVSSTVREVLPVVRVDGQPVGNGRVGDRTRAIHRRFRQKWGIAGAMPWETSEAQ
jgi:branched-chain amino acid aminotransferase